MNTQKTECENLSDIIALIYDAAYDPELWPSLLQQLNDMTDKDKFKKNTTSVVTENNKYTQLLRPHFQRALELNKTIYSLQTERDAVSDILDRLPIGVILVNAEKIPLAMNKHAESLIQAAESLSICQGKLVAATRADTLKLHQSIQQAATNDVNEHQTDHNLLISTTSDDVCSLHVVPSAHTDIPTEQPLAAIFIASSNIQQSVSVASLTGLFALTIAEAKLVQNLLQRSNSLTEAAEGLNVSKHTVRTHMRSILDKTNTHSQTELIKKILNSPAALIGEKQSPKAIKDLSPFESSKGIALVTPQSFKTITLHDGRKLEYREFGDPEGKPILFFHSCVHSRHAIHPSSQYLEQHGVRIIAPERPGFGQTSLLPQSNNSEIYANDIQQLMQHLNIKQYKVLADTSGAWAGFVCACFLSDHVTRLSVVTAYPEPRFDFPDKTILAERIMLKTYQTLHSIFLTHIAKIVLRGLSKKPEKYFDRVINELCQADQDIVTSPEHRAIMAEALNNTYPDRVKGYTDDFMQRSYAWDFDIEKCKVETQLWHGTANTIVSFEAAEKIKSSLLNARLFPVQDGGHYIIISHWDAILQELTSKSS